MECPSRLMGEARGGGGLTCRSSLRSMPCPHWKLPLGAARAHGGRRRCRQKRPAVEGVHRIASQSCCLPCLRGQVQQPRHLAGVSVVDARSFKRSAACASPRVRPLRSCRIILSRMRAAFIHPGVIDGITGRRMCECRAARPFIFPCGRAAACTWLWSGTSSRFSSPITGPGRVGSSEGPCISAVR